MENGTFIQATVLSSQPRSNESTMAAPKHSNPFLINYIIKLSQSLQSQKITVFQIIDAYLANQ
jgi:hypothetical protein